MVSCCSSRSDGCRNVPTCCWQDQELFFKLFYLASYDDGTESEENHSHLVFLVPFAFKVLTKLSLINL